MIHSLEIDFYVDHLGNVTVVERKSPRPDQHPGTLASLSSNPTSSEAEPPTESHFQKLKRTVVAAATTKISLDIQFSA